MLIFLIVNSIVLHSPGLVESEDMGPSFQGHRCKLYSNFCAEGQRHQPSHRSRVNCILIFRYNFVMTTKSLTISAAFSSQLRSPFCFLPILLAFCNSSCQKQIQPFVSFQSELHLYWSIYQTVQSYIKEPGKELCLSLNCKLLEIEVNILVVFRMITTNKELRHQARCVPSSSQILATIKITWRACY